MYYIKDAAFRRVTELEGTPCAEIQVRPGAVDDPDLFVYIARSEEGPRSEFEIIRMIRSDASLETDWFDNNMHQATATVAEEEFCNTGWPAPEKQRKEFLQRLLAHEGISDRLNKEL
ncbi:hypothetical protein [Paenibacillus sp. DYY-L-2]|uniref:hypothetical protein n=1 Tax=Paenibacillus sp. DYY-L-2 TaxID=3447013 RepID=UPI003F50C1C5